MVDTFDLSEIEVISQRHLWLSLRYLTNYNDHNIGIGAMVDFYFFIALVRHSIWETLWLGTHRAAQYILSLKYLRVSPTLQSYG